MYVYKFIYIYNIYIYIYHIILFILYYIILNLYIYDIYIYIINFNHMAHLTVFLEMLISESDCVVGIIIYIYIYVHTQYTHT